MIPCASHKVIHSAEWEGRNYCASLEANASVLWTTFRKSVVSPVFLIRYGQLSTVIMPKAYMASIRIKRVFLL